MAVDFNVLSQMNANNPALMDRYQAANGNTALQQQIQDQYSSSLGGYAQNDRNAANAGHPVESTGYHFGVGSPQTVAQQTGGISGDGSGATQYGKQGIYGPNQNTPANPATNQQNPTNIPAAPNDPNSQFGQGMSLQPNSPAVMPSLNKAVASGLYTGFGGSSIAGPTPTTGGLPDFGVHSNQNQSTGNPQYSDAGTSIGGTGVQSSSGLSNPNFVMPTGATPQNPNSGYNPDMFAPLHRYMAQPKPITPAPMMRVPPVTAPVMNTLNRSVMRYSNPVHYKNY